MRRQTPLQVAEIWLWNMTVWPWRWPQLMLKMTLSNSLSSETHVYILRSYL